MNHSQINNKDVLWYCHHASIIISHNISNYRLEILTNKNKTENNFIFEGSVEGSLLSKLGLSSCDLITVSHGKSSMAGPQRSVIADKILKISGRDTHVSLCQEAGVPCQQLSFQNPQNYDQIQGMRCLQTA